jgi:hypothetical protein
MEHTTSITIRWRYFLLVLITLTISPLLEEIHSQNLLNIPESIIFDSTHHRYLISNYSSGDIVQVDSTGHQSYLVQQQGTNFQGLEIAGNVIYVGANQYIKGYDLETGQMVMNIHVPNVTNLNDVTADTSGNLYVSDVFSTKIIKVRISTQNYSVFIDGRGIDHPNGLLYDIRNNRVLVCSFRTNSPIQSINLSDSTVTTLTNTTLSFCDGITMDRYGRYYVTSWTTMAIYRFDSVFSSPPYLFYQNSCGPADISYDRVHDVIAIPLQQCNTWDVAPSGIGIKRMQEKTPQGFILEQNFPNPFNPLTVIRFNSSQKAQVNLSIFDIRGKLIGELLNDFITAGSYEVEWDGSEYSSGIYFCKFKAEGFADVKKMVLVK